MAVGPRSLLLAMALRLETEVGGQAIPAPAPLTLAVGQTTEEALA